MIQLRIGSALAALCLSACSAGQALAQQADSILPGDRQREVARPVMLRKIVLVGDSTVAPMSGWGGVFCSEHVAATVACLNLARGGRSTRSYIEEGSWAAALAEASTPGYQATYVLIQFGHNDQNHTLAVWTDLDREFPDNLRRYVREARERGAVPVLVTPVVRRQFRDGRFVNVLAEWAGAMREVAAELDVPVLDLNQRSAELVAAMGEQESHAWAQLSPGEQEAAPSPANETQGPRYRFRRRADPTHLGDVGARAVAAIVAQQLAEAVPDLAGAIAP